MGSYFCVCPRGYVTSTDGSRCIGKPLGFEKHNALLLSNDRTAQTGMEMAAIIKPLGKWLKELFMVLLSRDWSARCSCHKLQYQKSFELLYVVRVIFEMRKEFLKTLLSITDTKARERFLKICFERQSVVINSSFIVRNHECSQCLIYLTCVYSSEDSYYKKKSVPLILCFKHILTKARYICMFSLI